MSTVQNESPFRRVIKKVSAYIPQVEKPKKKISLTEKFVWSGIALFAYLIMGQIPLDGVTSDPKFDFLAFARVIFAAQQGTLMELGIGPIVTAGLLMQLLKGSDLLKLNFKNPDDRSLFTSATKIATIIVIIAEGSLYGVSVYGHLVARPEFVPILVGQLVGASIIVMLLDELVQKGWGLGSGISLFIMAGVAPGILWAIFNPLPIPNYQEFSGLIPFMIQSGAEGHIVDSLLRSSPPEPVPNLPSVLGLGITGRILALLVYVLGIHLVI